MTYQVNPKNQNELKRIIQEKVKEAKDLNQTKPIKHNQQDFHLTRISVNRDWLYYNIQNDRTLTDIQEFIDEHELEESYFDEENSFNHQQQGHYHSIICQFVKPQMIKEFKTTQDQRDEIYITHEGIVANGNTRLACFRENDLFINVDCLVFANDVGDWNFIRQIVDRQDNAIDISTDYPWHARAKRIQKNQESGNDLESITRNMNYTKASDVQEQLHMLELAQEFVKRDYPGYSKLSDICNLGPDDGLQVFSTFAKGKFKKSYDQLDANIKEKLSNICFDVIGTKNKGGFSSTHLAVQNIWSQLSVVAQQEQFDALGETPDILGGDTPQTQDIDSAPFDINPYKDMTESEREEYTKKTLSQIQVIQSQKDDKTKKDAYRKELKQILSKLTDMNDLLLQPGINIADLDDIFSNLEAEIKKGRKKIDLLK